MLTRRKLFAAPILAGVTLPAAAGTIEPTKEELQLAIDTLRRRYEATNPGYSVWVDIKIDVAKRIGVDADTGHRKWDFRKDLFLKSKSKELRGPM
jgi:hypothetical protein